MYNTEYKFVRVGDIVNIDLEYIESIVHKGYIPEWYTSDSFEVMCVGYTSECVDQVAYLDRNISPYDNKNRINVKCLKLNISAMRKKKLNKLSLINME